MLGMIEGITDERSYCEAVARSYFNSPTGWWRGRIYETVRDLMLAGFCLLMLCSVSFGEDIFKPTGRYAVAVESDDGCYLVMFTASWCGPCQSWKRTHKPAIEAAGHKVAEIDIDQGNQWGVRTVPTFWVVDRATKKTVRTFVGSTSAAELLPLIKVRQAVKTTTKTVGNTIKTTVRTTTRMSHSAMVGLHNRLHGGGQWSWPGDLATHLLRTHGVQVDR